MKHNDLEEAHRRLARRGARRSVQRSHDAASRLRQDITSMAAELRARGGDTLTMTRCSWLRTVVCWRKDVLRAWGGAESLRRSVERFEAALASGRYAQRGALMSPRELSRYARELPEARARLQEALAKVQALVATAPPPYAEWRSAAGRISPAQITGTPRGSLTDAQPEPEPPGDVAAALTSATPAVVDKSNVINFTAAVKRRAGK